jgi:hypothetical protein
MAISVSLPHHVAAALKNYPQVIEMLNDQPPEVREKMLKLNLGVLVQAAENKNVRNRLVDIAQSKEAPSDNWLARKWLAIKSKFIPGLITSGVTAAVIGGVKYGINAAGYTDLPILGVNSVNAETQENVNALFRSEGSTKTFADANKPKDILNESLKTGGIVFGLSTAVNGAVVMLTDSDEIRQEIAARKQLWAIMHGGGGTEEMEPEASMAMHDAPLRPGYTPPGAHGAQPSRGLFG